MAKLMSFIKVNPLLAVSFFIFILVYSNSLTNGFQRDDIRHIVNNTAIRDISSFPKVFSREYFQLHGSVTYRPAVAVIRFLEYKVFGLDQRLWRLFNLLLHAINAFLLFSILLKISGCRTAASVAGALFLIHPVHTEALNYISNGQCDILCLFFLCVSFLAYLGERTVLSLVSFCLALFSKEMALSFPFFLALYGYLYGSSANKRRIALCGVVVALVFVVWRLVYFKAAPGFIDNVQADTVFGFSAAIALSASFKFPVLVVYYLKLLIWPSVLSVEADRLLPEAGLFFIWNMVFSWFLFASTAVISGVFYSRNKIYVFFLLAFTMSLLPVSGLLPLTSVIQEHFTYIPSVFFCCAVGLISVGMPIRRTVLISAGCAVLAVSAARIWSRNADWKSPLALAESDLKFFPDSGTAILNLAVKKHAMGEYAAAMALCREAVLKAPETGEAHFLMADMYLREGEKAAAMEAVLIGLGKNRDEPDPLVNAARIYARAGRLSEATAACGKAIARFPYFEPAYLTMGEIMLLKKDRVGAEKMFKEAVRLNNRSQAVGKTGEAYRKVVE